MRRLLPFFLALGLACSADRTLAPTIVESTFPTSTPEAEGLSAVPRYRSTTPLAKSSVVAMLREAIHALGAWTCSERLRGPADLRQAPFRVSHTWVR